MFGPINLFDLIRSWLFPIKSMVCKRNFFQKSGYGSLDSSSLGWLKKYFFWLHLDLATSQKSMGSDVPRRGHCNSDADCALIGLLWIAHVAYLQCWAVAVDPVGISGEDQCWGFQISCKNTRYRWRSVLGIHLLKKNFEFLAFWL